MNLLKIRGVPCTNVLLHTEVNPWGLNETKNPRSVSLLHTLPYGCMVKNWNDPAETGKCTVRKTESVCQWQASVQEVHNFTE